MLSEACRRFQSGYERGSDDPHLESCAACREFVAFVDGLGRLGVGSPLGDELRARLRRLPYEREGLGPFPSVPQLPLPARLAERLRRIARRSARDTLPIWIRSPRYAIAASYLLTLLLAGTVGNPAAWAGEAEQRLDRVGSALKSVQVSGRATLHGLAEMATEGVALSKDFLRTSNSALAARWLEVVDSLNEREITQPQTHLPETTLPETTDERRDDDASS